MAEYWFPEAEGLAEEFGIPHRALSSVTLLPEMSKICPDAVFAIWSPPSFKLEKVNFQL